MKNLLTTTAFNLWVLRDNEWFDFSGTQRLPHYGLTWSPQEVFFGYSNHVKIFTKQKVFTEKKTTLSNAHQILWIDGDLYIAANGEDKILKITKDGEILRSKKIDDVLDRPFMNSVSYDTQTNTILGTAHGLGKPSFIVRLDTDLNILEYYPNLECSHVHDVYAEGDLFYYLNSIESKLKIYDKSLKKVVNIVNLNASINKPKAKYLRGLAVDEDEVYIGVAYSEGNDQRDNESCIIVCLDKETLQIKEEIILPKSGQIREVRLAKDDLAHNTLNFPFDLNDIK